MKEAKTAYLFVGGIFGGLLRPKLVFSYFQDMEQLLRQTDPDCHTEFIQNPSWKNVDHGSQLISQKVKELSLVKGYQVIIVAHSRGSLELLNFASKYPELAEHSMVKKFVFTSPLFGKSHMAELLHKYLRFILPPGLKKALAEVGHDGVRVKVQALWQNSRDSIQDKSLLIKTSTYNVKHIPAFLRLSYFIIKKYAGENDGVLALSSQASLEGVQEAKFYSNHGAIFCNKKINRIDQVDISDVLNFVQHNEETKSMPLPPVRHLKLVREELYV